MVVSSVDLSPPNWTLEEKVQLTAQVLGADRQEKLQGNVFHRLTDSSIQWIFRMIIPLSAQLAVDKKWIELQEGYLRFGRLSKCLARIPFAGNRFTQLVSKLVGQMVIRNQFWKISPEPPADLVDLANEYLKFAEGIGLEIDYSHSRADEDEAVIYISKCSAGVRPGYPKGACYAMNEMDREVIRLLGGKLQTSQTIAGDGRYCCFRIRKASEGQKV